MRLKFVGGSGCQGGWEAAVCLFPVVLNTSLQPSGLQQLESIILSSDRCVAVWDFCWDSFSREACGSVSGCHCTVHLSLRRMLGIIVSTLKDQGSGKP